MLRPFDRDKRVFLICDGSTQGTAYAIYQLHNGKPHPILFGGQSLNQSQSRWSIHEIEAFSLLQALNTHYSILQGTSITVLTDNSTLRHWDNLQFQSMRTKRWSTIFSNFRLNFVQIKSKQNPVDAISRMYDDMTPEQRSKVTPIGNSDETDDFVLSVSETGCLPALNLLTDNINENVSANDSILPTCDVAANVPTPSVSSRINMSPNTAVCTDTDCVNAVITRSMAKTNAPTVDTAAVDHLGSDENKSADNLNLKPDSVPTANSNSAVAAENTKLLPTVKTAANASDKSRSTEKASGNKTATKSNNLKPHDRTTARKTCKSDSMPADKDAQLPFQHAQLDSESDEPTDEINEMQLQSALDITVNDYLACPEFGNMMRFKLRGELVGDDTNDRKTLLIADDFVVIDNLLYRITAVRNKKLQRVRPYLTRLCIPKRFQFNLVDKVHTIFSHAAYEKLSAGLRQRYFFSSLNDLAYQIPRTCKTCNEAKPSSVPMPELHPHSHSGKWNEVWSIDHMALPRPTSAGHRYLLLCIEQSTRWVEAEFCFTTSSRETAQHILRHIIANHGPPSVLRVDRASTNISKLMHVFFDKFNIKLIPSAARASQSQGLVERTVLAVKNAIRLLCETDNDIETALGEILIALRSSPSKSLAVSPFYAKHGHEFDLLGFNSPFTPPTTLTSKDQQFLIGFNKHLQTVRDAVKVNILESKQVMAEQYNKYHHAAPSPFRQGSFVLLHTPLKGNSPAVLSHKPYKDVYVIVDVVNNPGYGVAYRLANVKTGRVRPALVPAYRLKIFHSREPLLNKYKPEGSTVQPDVNAAAVDATPEVKAQQRAVSLSNQHNKPVDSLSESPAVRILQQRGDNYLILRENKSRTWVKRSPQLDSLIQQYLLKRENSRLKRNESRHKNNRKLQETNRSTSS